MLFSILIPVYNCEQYIEDCLESIVSQSGNDYEVIIVDDGSTDGSGIKCDLYAKKYKQKVTVIHKKNQGSYLSRRELLKNAHGDYVLFVDSDDYINLNALTILKEKIKMYDKLDLVIFEYARIDGKNVYESNIGDFIKNNEKGFIESKEIIWSAFLRGNELNSMCTKLFSRQLLEKCISDLPNERVEIGEDLLQMIAVISRAENITYLDKVLYYCRIHGDNSCLKFNKSRFNDARIIGDFFEKKILMKEIVWQNIILVNHKVSKMIFFAVMQLALLDCKLSFISQYKYLKIISENRFFHKIYSENGKELRKAEKFPMAFLSYNKPILTLVYLNLYKNYINIRKKIGI